MSENKRKSPFARLMVDANGKPYTVDLGTPVHIGFTLAADGDKLNGEASTPQDLETIHQNFMAKRPDLTASETYTPEDGQQYLLPEPPKSEPSF